MALKLGATTINGAFMGSTAISRGYLGATEVFASGGAVFSPADLFSNGEVGAWYDPSDISTMFTDTAGTTPANVGDPVARINDKSGNGFHATQSTAAARPILRQVGSLYYLDFDGVDDFLAGPTSTASTTNETSIAYDPQAVDFVMKWVSGAVYFGIGIDGSTSTALSGAEVLPRSEYFNNALSANTTRGENYTSAQNSNLWLGRTLGYLTDNVIKIGAISSAIPGPRRVYQYLYREGQMTDDQRASWSTYALAKVGVTL